MNDPVTVNAPRAPGLEGRLEAFEAALAAGGSVDLFRFLPPAGDPEYLPTLCELVRTDLEARWALGRPKGLAEYQQQYPELFADPELAAAVAFEDRRQRELHQTGVVPVNPVGGSTRAVPRSEFERYAAASSGAGNGAAGLDRTRLPDVGTEFLGFRLTEELGTGGFGRVYLAQQLALSDRPVALKVTVRPNREAQHLARLQHTNIVPVLSVHEADGLQALCMPYFGRSTLRQVINSIRLQPSLPASGAGLISTLRLSAHQTVREDGGPAPAAGTPAPAADSTAAPTRDRLAHLGYVDAVVWLVARIADGLAHAHERGILHRDLKPANVLLADDGQPMLLDFNLAHHSPGAAGASGGTLLYMSPEHLAAFAGDRTRTVDARSDLYSLGLVMYELL
ncbi:MAG: serine/threonine-protein kinase, partial [Gemmata sp.]